jgi:pimeloyl-ACP methyl ester carboxylesterase
VVWLWIGLGIVLGLPLAVVLFLTLLYFYLIWHYLHHLVRIFEEKPLFIIPRGQPLPGAEDVRFPTADGLTLAGCYLRGAAVPGRGRRGIILFAPEFGANRWSCVPYGEHLLAHGFDVFAFDFRGQGDSDPHPGYTPLQWVTAYEVTDVQAALAYLKGRGDADPRGVGFFGMSRGGSAGLLAGARDPYLRCFVTDGIFATYTTMVPYMRKWIGIYSQQRWLQTIIPDWYYGLMGCTGLRRIRRERGCRFPHLERSIGRLAPRPLLMVHGGADTYIKPEMAQALYDRAGVPKEFWLVEGAKHNQAIQVAADEYRRRTLEFFLTHLAPAWQENGGHAPGKQEARKQEGPV